MNTTYLINACINLRRCRLRNWFMILKSVSVRAVRPEWGIGKKDLPSALLFDLSPLRSYYCRQDRIGGHEPKHITVWFM